MRILELVYFSELYILHHLNSTVYQFAILKGFSQFIDGRKLKLTTKNVKLYLFLSVMMKKRDIGFLVCNCYFK